MKYKIECGISNGLIRYYVKKKVFFMWTTIYVAAYITVAEGVVEKLLMQPKYYETNKIKI